MCRFSKNDSRQPDEMAEETGAELKLHDVLDDQQDQAAKRGGCRPDDRQQPEAEGQHHQKVDVASRDHLVDRDLHVEGRGEHEELQDHRQNEDLDEGVAASAQVAPEDREAAAARARPGARTPSVGESSSATPVRCFEASASERYFSPEAGSWMAMPFRLTDLSTTKWLMSQCRMAGSRSCRRCSSSKRSGRPEQVQLARHLDEGPQRHAVERHGVAAPQRVQIDAVAVVRGHHREAGEPALGRFRLTDEGQAPAAAEAEEAHRSHPYAAQRVREPADERALLEDDVGFEKHVGLERHASCRRRRCRAARALP